MPFGLGTVRKDPVRNRSETRSALTRFLLVGLSSLVLVAAPTVLLFNHIARDHGLETVMESGQNVTIRRPRWRASSNANRTIRSAAGRVISRTLSTTPGTTSCSNPAYSPSVFSRTTLRSTFS